VLYVPGVHRTAVPFVDPEGHAYPSVHCPLHAAELRLVVDPKVPAGQGSGEGLASLGQ
jgi:hypothetical protein